MFYDPRSEPHRLSRNPLTALVVPRPIGWISSLSADGIANLAPYSFFNMISAFPPFVIFSSDNTNGAKDSQANIEATGEFVVNMAIGELTEEVNASAARVAPDVDEFELVGLEKALCKNVKVPRVAASPVALECTLNKIVPLVTSEGVETDNCVIGEVVGIHINDDVIVDGLLDITRIKPLTRLGYRDYAIIDKVFEVLRPNEK